MPRTSDPHQKFQLTYHDFANAWRITDKSSLFDYDAGKSTASYTNAAFPNEQSVVTPAQLTDTQRSQAAGPCAGVTDLGLLEQCLFDVSITGDAGFAAGYGLIQGLVTTGPDVLNGGPSPSPSAAPRSGGQS